MIHHVFILKDHGFGDTSEKTWQVHPTRSEQHVDVILERWKGNTESILLIVRVYTCASIV